MNTGTALALVHLRYTMGIMISFRAVTNKLVYFIDTCTSIMTWVGGTLIYVNIAHGSCISGTADAIIAINTILTASIVTWVAGTVIIVNLTINTRGANWASTLVFIHTVLAGASVLTGLTLTLVDLLAADQPLVTRIADAGVAGDPILAHPIVAGVWTAVVFVNLTHSPHETFTALALKSIWPINTFGSVLAWGAGTFINVDVAHISSETRWALASKSVHLVLAHTIVEAWLAFTLINICFAVYSHEAWHTNALEFTDLIQTGGIVLAGTSKALVDVHFTAWSRVAHSAFTAEGTLGVYTLPSVFAGISP